MSEFTQKNSSDYSLELLKKIGPSELFKPGILNIPMSTTMNNFDINNLFPHFDKNPLFLSTLESFKNISRSINNINYGLNNYNQAPYDYNINNAFQKNYNNINQLNFPQKDNPQQFKMNSETSSMSSDNRLKEIIKGAKQQTKLFNSTQSIGKHFNEDHAMFIKKRKRYIKNNKFVYVHPGSAAAKKMELERVIFYFYF